MIAEAEKTQRTARSPAVRSTVDVTLRSTQADYIAYLARREDISQSKALGLILEDWASKVPDGIRRAPRKARKHFWIKPHHLALLDTLAARWGLSRSDVARRLIDAAAAER